MPPSSPKSVSPLPPPGKLVDIGGFRMHLNSQGTGKPAVLLEGDLCASSLAWSLIQPEIAGFTRVYSYDRAGLGWSDPSLRPRTSTVIADELFRLLSHAANPAPFILVGANMGGIHVRTFADRYPDLVAGMVLVDSLHDGYWRRIPEEAYQVVKRTQAEQLTDYQALSALPHAKILKTLKSRLPKGYKSPYPPTIRALADDRCRPETQAGAVRELHAVEIISTMTRDASFYLGNKPLVVLTAGVAEADPNLSEEDNAQVERVWHMLQTDMLNFSANSRQVIVDCRRQCILTDQPGAVVEAVRSVVEAVRPA
jgi:pimeloyl-ACP methyl ester carboxylesterase